MSKSTIFKSNIINAEQSIEFYPKFWRNNNTKLGIIYCHGFGSDALECDSPSDTRVSMYNIINKIVNAGYPVLSCDFGINSWGNNASISKLDYAVNYMSAYMGSKIGKIGLIGQSMGHLTAMNWAAQNIAKVNFVISSMGVADLNNIHSNPTYNTSIDAAYGGTYSDATFGQVNNPFINAGTKFAGLKWLGLGGSSDTTAPPTITSTLKTAIGSTASYTQVVGGHSWDTVLNYDTNAILNFINTNS